MTVDIPHVGLFSLFDYASQKQFHTETWPFLLYTQFLGHPTHQSAHWRGQTTKGLCTFEELIDEAYYWLYIIPLGEEFTPTMSGTTARIITSH